MVKPSITHIDLFAGPGGIATGFKACGINTVIANEYIDSVCETYGANHPETKMLCGDIRDLINDQIKKEIKKLNLKSIDIVSAGFPCETFSTAGSKSRASNDHRNLLYKEAIRIADAAKAKVLMLENVPAFLTKKVEKGSDVLFYDLLMQDLKASGYKYIQYKILNAADYGVPQSRQRFVMLASKTIDVADIDIPVKNHKVTVAEAFTDLPLIEDNLTIDVYASEPENEYQMIMRDPAFWNFDVEYEKSKLTYHITPKHRPGTKLRFELIRQGEGLKDVFMKHTEEEIQRLQADKILPKKWFIQRNYRLISDRPSKTVTSHCLDEIVHPILNRGLSVREAARLQSFPDWYDFKGGPLLAPHMYKTQDKYEQIGDAVPPLLAKAIGEYIIGLLNTVKNEAQINDAKSESVTAFEYI